MPLAMKHAQISLPPDLSDPETPLLHHSAQQINGRNSLQRRRNLLMAAFFMLLLVVGVLIGTTAFVHSVFPSYDVKTVAANAELPEDPQVLEVDNGIVAADDERCSAIGSGILRNGGNAVDAAVATALCEGVVNPTSSGIGGGAFLVLRLADGTAKAYDMREVAPGASSEDMYENNKAAKSEGALSIGVPGELAGLYLVWQHHGKLQWEDLVTPAINLAENGFVVSRYLGYNINNKKDKIMSYDGMREAFAPNGKLLVAGDIMFRKRLAQTLTLVAKNGPSVLYNGTVGANLVADVQKAGGILSRNDLLRYRVRVRTPTITNSSITNSSMGFSLIGMPPPSSGGAAVNLVFNILSNYWEAGETVPEDLALHRMIEAFKHAYAVRMNLGDPDFVNVTDVMADMLSPDFASQLWKRIVDNQTFAPEYYGGKWNQLNDHGTSHFNIVDADRNAVSMTTTVNYVFGSLILSSSTGILLNNEMDDFSIPSEISPNNLPPAKQNFIRPHKRPLSSMSPTILLQNGQLRGVLGASGGIRIITGTIQVLINYFLKGMDPLAAVMKPRIHHQLVPNVVEYEDWTTVTGEHIDLPYQSRQALQKRGHHLIAKTAHCITQLVIHDLSSPANPQRNSTNRSTYLGKLIGVSDFRKGGAPAGF